MNDFEVCPVGTARRIAELETAVKDLLAEKSGQPKSCGHNFYCVCPGDKAQALVREFTDEEKSDMYWESNTAEGIAPDEDLPVFLKPQAD